MNWNEERYDQKTVEMDKENFRPGCANHVGAYASQSAFFFVAVTDSDYFTASDDGTVHAGNQDRCDESGDRSFSKNSHAVSDSIINEVYSQSKAMIL